MERIWFKNYTLEELNARGSHTLVDHIGIVVTELGEGFLRGTMPVDHRTKQPLGLLHGGASVALAESLGSIAANLIVDPSKNFCVGLEINANHISSCRDGVVVGTARPIHLGKSTQIWETEIHQGDRLVCISRLTMAVLEKKK